MSETKAEGNGSSLPSSNGSKVTNTANGKGLPSDDVIKAAISRIFAANPDTSALTMKKVITLLSKELGVDVGEKKPFIKAEVLRLINEDDSSSDEEEEEEEDEDLSSVKDTKATSAPSGNKRARAPAKTSATKKKAKTTGKGKGKGKTKGTLKGKGKAQAKKPTAKQVEKRQAAAEKRRKAAEKLQAVAPMAPVEEKKIAPGSYWDSAPTGDRRAAVAAFNKMPQHWSVKYREKKQAEKEKAAANGEEVKPKPAAKKNARKVLLSPALADFMGGPTLMPRQDVVKHLHEYFKAKNLKDPDNGRQILLDEPLQAVFKCKKFTYFSMNKKLSKLLKDPKDVV